MGTSLLPGLGLLSVTDPVVGLISALWYGPGLYLPPSLTLLPFLLPPSWVCGSVGVFLSSGVLMPLTLVINEL